MKQVLHIRTCNFQLQTVSITDIRRWSISEWWCSSFVVRRFDKDKSSNLGFEIRDFLSCAKFWNFFLMNFSFSVTLAYISRNYTSHSFVFNNKGSNFRYLRILNHYVEWMSEWQKGFQKEIEIGQEMNNEVLSHDLELQQEQVNDYYNNTMCLCLHY